MPKFGSWEVAVHIAPHLVRAMLMLLVLYIAENRIQITELPLQLLLLQFLQSFIWDINIGSSYAVSSNQSSIKADLRVLQCSLS